MADGACILEQPPTRTGARLALAFYHRGRWNYPSFQFDEAGEVRPKVAELREVLPRDPDGTMGNRDAILWLYAPDAAFEGRTPSEAFLSDPDHVIHIARTRRDGPD